MLIVLNTPTFPEKLKDGWLYVSEQYKTAAHLCACGCGQETITPLGDGGWNLTMNNKGATLSPSIGNYKFDCRSHYWIRDNEVVWA